MDPYKAIITTRLATYPALSAVRLMAECRAAGYAGGYTQLRDFVRRVRPVELPEPIVRFETAPGKQAQVDFAEFRFPWDKRYALLVVLGYSRLPAIKTLADFDFIFQPSIKRDQIESLHTLGFLDRKENVIPVAPNCAKTSRIAC